MTSTAHIGRHANGQKFFALGDQPRSISLLLCWSAVRSSFTSTCDDELRSWVGGSELPWCFNLGTGTEREFICVLASCVREQQLRIRSAERETRNSIQNWEEAIAAALPPTQNFFSSALARLWNINADRMDRLIASELSIVPKNYQVNEPRLITRASAEQFLKRRAMR